MPATTLDDELRQCGLAAARPIKIDTEGAEQQVLQGATGHLADRKIPFIVAELHEFGLAKLGNSQQSLRGLMEGRASWINHCDRSILGNPLGRAEQQVDNERTANLRSRRDEFRD